MIIDHSGEYTLPYTPLAFHIYFSFNPLIYNRLKGRMAFQISKGSEAANIEFRKGFAGWQSSGSCISGSIGECIWHLSLIPGHSSLRCMASFIIRRQQ